MSLRRGFTLVEMIVVIAIMMMIMGTLLPAMALLQKKSDLYGTTSVLTVVHEVQQRSAQQFGSAGMVYGYTIRGDRAGVDPWVIKDALTAPTTRTAIDHGDVGKQMFWGGDTVQFTDNIRIRTAADTDVYFVPRTGFVHTVTLPMLGPADPITYLTTPGNLLNPAAIVFESSRTGNRAMYEVKLLITGAIDVQGK